MPFCEHQHYAGSSRRIKAPLSEVTRPDLPTKAALRNWLADSLSSLSRIRERVG